MTTTQERRAQQLDRFEHATELPLLVLALAMIPLLIAPVALDLPARTERALLTLDWLIWGVFGAELAFRVYLAPRKLSYLAHHWYDVLLVALPFLRPLRTFRSARALPLLRGARVLAHTTRTILGRKGVQGSVLFALASLIASVVIVTIAERGAAGPIDGFGTGAWWAVTTVTTVGYGDTYPVTAIGRGVGAALMFVGIGLFGVLTANVAAYFVESARDEPSPAGDDPVLEVLAELRRLHERLDAAGLAEGASATRDA